MQSQEKPKPMSQRCGPAKAECEATKPKHMEGQKLPKIGKSLSFSSQAIPLFYREPSRISNWAVKVHFFVSEVAGNLGGASCGALLMPATGIGVDYKCLAGKASLSAEFMPFLQPGRISHVHTRKCS